MDLTTNYLGLRLANPFIVGAGPMVDQLDAAKRLEDCGAGAVVMRSLFEEQLSAESLATTWSLDTPNESFAEARTYLPDPIDFVVGPDEYLEKLQALKATLRIPVIASLNGDTLGGWLDYAIQIADAGADALELNIYHVATDLDESSHALEHRIVEMVRSVKQRAKLPIAVKLSPFYTALPHFARELVAAGADGLVLFNRFFEPDIDVEELVIRSHLHLSHSPELLLRIRWLAILSGRVDCTLAVSGGVHTPLDAIKATMAGAHGIQLVSALLRNGPEYVRHMISRTREWLVEQEYESLGQMRGSMNLQRCPNPSGLERANYMHMLQTWQAV